MLGSAQVRACFAEKTVLCGKGFLAKCSGPHRSAPNLPRKSWSVPGLWANARVRAAPRRFCREHRAPCWFLGKMLRSASSLQRKPCSVKFRYASALHAWVGQVRAGFAEKAVLRARLLSYSSSAAIFPRKPRLVSECNAWVRAGPRRVCRENPAPRCVVVLYRDSTRSALWKFAVAEFAIS